MGYCRKASLSFSEFHFQFPLWDTSEITITISFIKENFQFPLWDTLYTFTLFQIGSFNFQFPLWDTEVEDIYKTIKAINFFQFPLWDTNRKYRR